MKKVLIGFIVLIITITASFIVFEKNLDKNIENLLVKSMEENEKDKKKLEQFLMKTSQELNGHGYDQVGLSFSFLDRNLTVQVQKQTFLETNRKNIEKVIYDIAEEIELQDFEIDYMTLDSYPTISEEDEKLRDSIMQTYGEISNILQEKGYYHNSLSMEPSNKIIIELQGTQGDLVKSKEIKELEKYIAQTILSKSNMELEVKIKKKSKSAIRDQEWQPIFNAIVVETEKQFEEYRGFAYSFHPEPLQIIIKTDLESPKWFRNSNKKVNQITEYVDKIIELKRNELSIEEIPYAIIIRDKNDKKIN